MRNIRWLSEAALPFQLMRRRIERFPTSSGESCGFIILEPLSREVPREPEVDYELERREITEEYCDTVNCNDFKPTEKSTSGAAAFSALTSLLIALAFNN